MMASMVNIPQPVKSNQRELLTKDCLKQSEANVDKSVKNSLSVADSQKKINTDRYLADILLWNASWLKEALNPLMTQEPPLCPDYEPMELKLTYDNSDEYIFSHLPYVMHEIWADMVETWSKIDPKASESRYHRCECPTYGVNGSFLILSLEMPCKTLIHKSNKDFPSEGDIVLVQCQLDPLDPEQIKAYGSLLFCFGYVSRITFENVDHQTRSRKKYIVPQNTKMIYGFEVKTRRRPLRIVQKGVSIQKLVYVKPALRHVESLLSIERSFLKSDIMKPRFNTCQMAFPTEGNLTSPVYNKSQYEAILASKEALMRGQTIPKILLIQGPPGTGKTHTLVGIIKEIYSEWNDHQNLPKILVCAPSNGAVDEIGKRLYAARHFLQSTRAGRTLRIVRIGQEEQISKELVTIGLDHLVNSNLTGMAADNNDRLERRINGLEETIAALDVQISNHRRLGHNHMINSTEMEMERLNQEMQRLRFEQESSSKNSAGGTEERRGRMERLKRDILRGMDVVMATLNSCRSGILLEIFGGRNSNTCFNCVIIDEASQCSEPEVLMPLGYTSISKMILIGDPMQLPATVKSTTSINAGYGRSLFERFFHFFGGYNDDVNKNPVHMLKEQYRMHEEICKFPSKEFYYSRLTSHPKAGIKDSQFPLNPYTVIDLEDTVHDKSSATNIFNTQEAEFIVRLCKSLMAYIKLGTSIGIITPYQGQKKLIMQKLSQNRNVQQNLTIDVNTIDGFQGQERDIIIFSSVRAIDEGEVSHGIGFMGSKQRLNVALTRARFALVVIVSRKTLECNKLWKSLMDDAEERKCLKEVSAGVQSLSVLSQLILVPELCTKTPAIEDGGRKSPPRGGPRGNQNNRGARSRSPVGDRNRNSARVPISFDNRSNNDRGGSSSPSGPVIKDLRSKINKPRDDSNSRPNNRNNNNNLQRNNGPNNTRNSPQQNRPNQGGNRRSPRKGGPSGDMDMRKGEVSNRDPRLKQNRDTSTVNHQNIFQG